MHFREWVSVFVDCVGSSFARAVACVLLGEPCLTGFWRCFYFATTEMCGLNRWNEAGIIHDILHNLAISMLVVSCCQQVIVLESVSVQHGLLLARCRVFISGWGFVNSCLAARVLAQCIETQHQR